MSRATQGSEENTPSLARHARHYSTHTTHNASMLLMLPTPACHPCKHTTYATYARRNDIPFLKLVYDRLCTFHF